MKLVADGSSGDVTFIAIKHDGCIVEGLEVDGTGATGAALTIGSVLQATPTDAPILAPVSLALVRRLRAHSGRAHNAVQFTGARNVTP